MNKNTKNRLKQLAKNGGLTKYVHKKKAKPFPKGVAEMTMAQQREIYYGKKTN